MTTWSDLSPAERDECHRLHRDGMSICALARRYGLNRGALWHALYPDRAKSRRVAYYHRNHTAFRVAKTFGLRLAEARDMIERGEAALPVCVSKPERLATLLFAHFGCWVSRERISHELWWDSPDGSPLWSTYTIRGLISRLRPAFAPYGYAIENRHGHGYRLVRAEAAPEQFREAA